MQQEAGQREGQAPVVQVSSSPYLGPGSGCEGEQAATLETCLGHLWIGDVPSETGGCSHRPGPGWGTVEQALRILLCVLRIPRGMGTSERGGLLSAGSWLSHSLSRDAIHSQSLVINKHPTDVCHAATRWWGEHYESDRIYALQTLPALWGK